jgi:hypothetical protein
MFRATASSELFILALRERPSLTRLCSCQRERNRSTRAIFFLTCKLYTATATGRSAKYLWFVFYHRSKHPRSRCSSQLAFRS